MKESKKKKLGLRFIISFYDAYLRERNLTSVARSLGISPTTINKKVLRHPVLGKVMELADEFRKANSMKDYVLDNLSPSARKTWEDLELVRNDWEAVDALFRGKPRKLRQELFVHSLLGNGFNVSRAMKDVGVDKAMLSSWRQDLDFLELMEEAHFHKKNFFENKFLGLVAESHPQAVIHANKTINADRGYGDKLSIAHSGDSGATAQLRIEDLPLDTETKMKVLEAIRQVKEERAAGQAKLIPASVGPG